MRRIRIQKQKPRSPRDLDEVPPLDPRDPDVLRVKAAARGRTAALRKAA
ncbi:MAG: hypothetical protein WD965_04840 [Actinomycetota bacterium]